MEEKVKVPWPGWKIVDRIGIGAYGAVYEIEREYYAPEHAAMKVMTFPGDQEDIEQDINEGYDRDSIKKQYEACLQDILNEYRLMLTLKGHTNIVSCEDVYVEEATDKIQWTIYIKMELLQPFTKYMEAVKEMTEDDVIKLGKDICNALIACDEHSVIHRDIKPGNILRNHYGNYKLGDFGIARTISHTMRGTIAGTADYMAPEIIKHGTYGKEVDIYSLGIVMYWAINKRKLPFCPMDVPITEKERVAALSHRISGDKMPTPVNASEGLTHIILKACAYDRKKRYRSAQELYEDLEKLSNGTLVFEEEPDEEGTEIDTPLPGDKAPVDTPSGKGIKGKKLPWTPIAVGVITLCCVGGWFGVKRYIAEKSYKEAIALKEEGKYEDAILAFENMKDFSDSAEQIQICEDLIEDMKKLDMHNEALALKDDGAYKDSDTQDDGFTNHTYELYSMNEYGLKTWKDIVTFCREQGGYIATINSDEENIYLRNMVKEAGYQSAFFGYTDRIQEGTWMWEEDPANTYENWAPGQPNNSPTDKHPDGEDYAQFAKDRKDGTWNDLYLGGNTKMFICEWDD